MKILIISTKFPNKVEFAKGIFVSEQVKVLANEHDVRVISPIPFYPKLHFFNKLVKYLNIKTNCKTNGILTYYPKYFKFPKGFLSKINAYFQFNAVKKTIIKSLKSWEIDIVHAHFTYTDGWIAYKISKEFKLPYVITEHNGSFSINYHRSSRKQKMTEALLNANQVIAVSQKLKADMHECVPQLDDIEVIPNGINIKNVIHKKTDEKANYLQLVSVGNLVSLKGYDLLLRAIRIVIDKGIRVKLNLIGDGPEREKLELLTKKLNLVDNVNFLGYQDHKNVFQYFSKADVFVSSSLIESFGVAVLEALAVGLPVIVTRSGGPENFVTKELGLIIEKGSVDELSNAIMKINQTYQEYDNDYISEYIQSNYNLKQIIMKIESQYKKVLKY